VVDRIITLVDEMFARQVGSAAAISVGDGGVEVERVVLGRTRRVPVPGPEADDRTWFDVASLTKPIATVAAAMVTANCRKKMPGMPLTKAAGTNTDTSTRLIATSAAETSSMLRCAAWRGIMPARMLRNDGSHAPCGLAQPGSAEPSSK